MRRARKGGVAILLAPKFKQLVSAHGSVLCNRGHWITLSGIPGGDLSFLKIYAPNTSRARTELWVTLVQELRANSRWIMGGDFNMVEVRQDKTNACGRLVPLEERAAFVELKQFLNLCGQPRSLDNERYS